MVWRDGKAGDNQSDPNGVARAMGEKAQAIGRPGLTTCRAGQTVPPDPEVVEKARRRRFTPEYKLKIVQEAEACSPGELGNNRFSCPRSAKRRLLIRSVRYVTCNNGWRFNRRG